jgi:hypothetical protein
MRKLEDVVKSLTESVVYECITMQVDGELSIAGIRAACTEALRRALPAEIEIQRNEAAANVTRIMAEYATRWSSAGVMDANL